jgi:hypothetical protein
MLEPWEETIGTALETPQGAPLPDATPQTPRITRRENGSEMHFDGRSIRWFHPCAGCGQLFCLEDEVHSPGYPFHAAGKNGGYPGLTEKGQYICRDCTTPAGQEQQGAFRPIELDDVPAMYATASLDRTPDGKPFPATLRKNLESWPWRKPFLLISGQPGSGKTHCSRALQLGMARQGRRVTFEDAPNWRDKWLVACRDPYSSRKREELERDIQQTRWLILDDLSATAATDGWKEQVHRILDCRTSNALPTLITTATGADETERRFGAAIRRRLQYCEHYQLPKWNWTKPILPEETA